MKRDWARAPTSSCCVSARVNFATLGDVEDGTMDEEKVNGVHAFDVVEIQPALFTSSTKRRIAELHTIHEKLENNGELLVAC